jgi:succinate dehydrogenase/fumarate reductase flavoprotein subunit
MDITRRNLVGAATVSASVAALAATTSRVASAEEVETADYTTDLLILGGGLAGLSAGLQALEDGIVPIIVDKASDIGIYSNSAIAGGSFATPYDDSEQAIDDYIADFNKKSKGKGDQDITRVIAENSQAAVDWLAQKGAQFNDPIENPPYSCMKVYASPAIFQGMRDLMQTLADKYASDGGEKLVNAKLIDLTLDDAGAVSGARVRSGDGVKTIRAKCTILATGGYVGNKELLEEFVGSDADEILLRGHPTMTGDGILAASRVGAMLRQMGGEQSLHIAAVSPDNVSSGNPSNAIAYCISINENGERYTDESLGYVSHGKALMGQPGQTCALVFDADTAQVSNVQIVTQQFDKLGIPIVQADTIEDLASQIGVDPATLNATVDEFNAASDGDRTTGLAVDKTACAVKVQTPPFYAIYPLQPGCIMGFGGLSCNADAQVLEADGTPIQNLFAAGELMGGVFMYDYMAGGSLERSAVFGRIAAKSAEAVING